MASISTCSTQFDNSELLVRELMLPAEGGEWGLGLLFCDSRVDYDKVVELVQAESPFPVVGGTTMSFPVSASGGRDVAATMLFVGKDRIKVSAAVSEVLCEAESTRQVANSLEVALAGLEGEPKLLFPLLPLIPGLNHDLFINSLFQLAGETPVFGTVSTDDLSTTKAAVFANGRAYTDRMVLLALGGDIRPVFSTSTIITSMAEYSPTVTESAGNLVRRVDDMTYCDYLRSLTIDPKNRENGIDALVQYGPLPVSLTYSGMPDDGVPVVRCVSYTNLQDGSAAFSSRVEPGTRVNLGIIDQDDVENSARRCVKILEERMASNADYHYETLICVSCVARYFVYVGTENGERAVLESSMPKSLASSDSYGFCEIGPTYERGSGRLINRSHNASIIMCAF